MNKNEKMSVPLPCIVCGKKLDPVFQGPEGWWQPSGAAVFRSSGHYGSNFDPMSGRISATLNVCDECMSEKRVSIRILRKKRRPIEYDVTTYDPETPL